MMCWLPAFRAWGLWPVWRAIFSYCDRAVFGDGLRAVSGGGGLDDDQGWQLPFGKRGGEAQVSV